jgi:hypothetical protein
MDNLQLSQGGSMCFTSGALEDGSNAGTISIAAAIVHTIDGQFMTNKAITDNISIAVSMEPVYGQPSNGSFTGGSNGSTRLYGLFLDSAGAVSVVPGPIVDTAALAAGEASLQYPPPQRAKACFGMLRIAVTSGTTFIPGTTALDAAGVTNSYLNLSSVPGEPVLA